MELDNYLRSVAETLRGVDSLSDTPSVLLQIAESSKQPFNVAVVGRMKTGKSTLINALIGKVLAISDVEEATATLNWICVGRGDQTKTFEVHWRDGKVDTYALDDLTKWSGKSDDVLDRIKLTAHLRMFSDSKYLESMQIIDTPGTGSAVNEHEIAGDFLNPRAIEESIEAGGKADAIIYVFPATARESDEETLEIFASGRLPNSGARDSVAVLHKWDSLSVDDPRKRAYEKASRLMDNLSGKVAAVIPVSAPLALAARSAPEDFFTSLITTLLQSRQDIERALQVPERWSRDTARKAILDQHPMPWASFRLLVRSLQRDSITDSKAARECCLRESGIETLESFLAKEFFTKKDIIKQSRLLKRAAIHIEPALRMLDLNSRQIGSSQLQNTAIELDREWQSCLDRGILLDMDLTVAEMIKENPEMIPEDHRAIILESCNYLAKDMQARKSLGRSKLPSIREIEDLISYYNANENFARKQERKIFSHIVVRLQEIHSILSEG